MTDDPITAAVQQLADHHDQLTQLTDLVTAIGDTLREHQAALTKLAKTPPADADPDGYHPYPPPTWWKLAAADRHEPIARLHAWVEQVYRPGYGHLAAALAPCWSSHDLCLYGLDILSDLWSVLYLQTERTPRMLSAQAATPPERVRAAACHGGGGVCFYEVKGGEARNREIDNPVVLHPHGHDRCDDRARLMREAQRTPGRHVLH